MKLRIASSPDASIFLLRLPWSRETECLNLGRPGAELISSCVVTLNYNGEKLNVFPVREASFPAELPLFLPPSPVPSSTPRLKYDESLSAYIARLQTMADSGKEGKIVASRVISAPPRAWRGEIFNRLSHLYPGAYVFYLSTPETGTWIGASPELLISRDGDTLKTMALAGTRPAGNHKEWDDKNIREQRMVTDFIIETFRHHGLNPQSEQTVTHNAGPVEHLMTPLTAKIPSDFNLHRTKDLISDLSPTPALCGLPREMAKELINKYESFNRHLYGGCIGRIWNERRWCFFVNLRSALLTSNATYLYVGGGITSLSDPIKEWEETELKAVTILKAYAPNSIHIPGHPPDKIVIRNRRHRRRPRH